MVGALQEGFWRHGAPKHIITDQEGVFISGVFGDLLRQWDVKQWFGAVGKHGAIAVAKQVIWALKHEWLGQVPVIRGVDHLADLLGDFGLWYNNDRGHMTLGGAVPSVNHRGEHWHKPDRAAKALGKASSVVPSLTSASPLAG